ncbi:MAG: hypothetical protein ACR2F2_09705 [Pyrinomonadaceae bacterium]
MLRKSRLYFSMMCAALVLVSLLMTSSARACEEEPQTLLSLYMNSDLIVLAKYESNGEGQKSFEDEYGYTLETGRNLSITKIFKGQNDLKTVSFMFSEYHSNPNQTVEETDYEEGYNHEDYFDVSKIKIGGEYLFFLSKNKETGEYSITDYVSGVKDLGGKSKLYEKNLNELGEIAAAKENQSALLTEWIVKSIENSETRNDGINDLAESFAGLSYQDEDPNFKDKGPFVINDGYGIYTVGVAKNLTQTQTSRVSAVLYSMLQEAWFAEKPQYANYRISAILGGINKSRLAVHAYNSLQTVGKEDVERKEMIMSFLTETVGDETLSKLYYDYSELEIKIGEAKKENTPEAKKQLKTMTASRDVLLKDFDKRFKFMFGRNFVPVEEKKA